MKYYDVEMENKVPTGLILKYMSDYPEASLQVIIDGTGHLPETRDFTLVIDTLKRLFKASGADEQLVSPEFNRLTKMARNLRVDRKSLRPVLKNVRNVLWEWDEWLDISDGGAKEEELQAHLERLADAMSQLRETLEDYESEVLAKLRQEW